MHPRNLQARERSRRLLHRKRKPKSSSPGSSPIIFTTAAMPRYLPPLGATKYVLMTVPVDLKVTWATQPSKDFGPPLDLTAFSNFSIAVASFAARTLVRDNSAAAGSAAGAAAAAAAAVADGPAVVPGGAALSLVCCATLDVEGCRSGMGRATDPAGRDGGGDLLLVLEVCPALFSFLIDLILWASISGSLPSSTPARTHASKSWHAKKGSCQGSRKG